MMRTVFFALALLAAAPLHADDVRTVATSGDLTLLSPQQRTWLANFESGALRNTAEAAWLDDSASSARAAGLKNIAAYLAVVANVLRGEVAPVEAEKAWRRTADDPLLVIVHIDALKIADITICTCDPARTKAIERAIHEFDRNIDRSPARGMTRIANLHFRAGRGVDRASTGTYLPFDRALIPTVGRTWIVYENMVRANWWGEALRPIALRILPAAASKATAEAMVAWYGMRAPLYDAGPPLSAADLDRLGTTKDPIRIMKGDLLPMLLAGVNEESEATLVAVSFDTLRDVSRGDAPPPHRTATTTEINWLVEHGALRFDPASVTWQIDFARGRDAVRKLAEEVLAIERAGDARRAEALFAKYAASTPAIEKTLEAVNALPRLKVQPLFVR